MKFFWTPLAGALACAIVLGGSVSAAAADVSLAAAKELYAAAAYEDALTMLGTLTDGGAPGEGATQIEAYRSFCLFALGRTAEAEAVARELIRQHPLAQLQDDEISPRVDAMFVQVRRQVLPSLIRERYKAGKTALDRKDFAGAETDLQLIRTMIAQADTLGVKDESLSDLGLLADGFLDLARAGAAKAEGAISAAAAAELKPATPEPVGSGLPARVFDAGDEDVAPPVAVRQDVPPIPPLLAKLTSGKRGVLEVTIEADGTVSSARMRDSIQVQYDTLIVRNARYWRYKPAVRAGAPVRYVKAVAVQITE